MGRRGEGGGQGEGGGAREREKEAAATAQTVVAGEGVTDLTYGVWGLGRGADHFDNVEFGEDDADVLVALEPCRLVLHLLLLFKVALHQPSKASS